MNLFIFKSQLLCDFSWFGRSLSQADVKHGNCTALPWTWNSCPCYFFRKCLSSSKEFQGWLFRWFSETNHLVLWINRDTSSTPPMAGNRPSLLLMDLAAELAHLVILWTSYRLGSQLKFISRVGGGGVLINDSHMRITVFISLLVTC